MCGFGFTLPSNASITGIEVKLEMHDTNEAGDLDIEIAYNGTNYAPTVKNTGTASATDAVYIVGGATDTWGRSWTYSEADDGNFQVRLTSRNDATIGVDALQANIHYTVYGGGGGGGGGEVSRPSEQHYANVFSAFAGMNPLSQLVLFVALISLAVALDFSRSEPLTV